jgi:lipoate-protein ligase B
MNHRPAYLLNLTATPYAEAYALQTEANAARHAGRLDRDLIIMLEHPPVYILGRRGGRENLVVPETFLRSRGIEIIPVERGGDITYHGPGQLVVYLVVDLKTGHLTVTDFVGGLEDAMAGVASRWGVAAVGNDDFRGAWIGDRKLGSVGITVRRGITFHGLALNVNTDLEPFDWINPCGIRGCAMTSLAREIGREVDMAQVRLEMAEQLSRRFGLSFESLDPETAEAILGLQGALRAPKACR